MNPLKTGDIYAHAQTVCTRRLLSGGEGGGLGTRLSLQTELLAVEDLQNLN